MQVALFIFLISKVTDLNYVETTSTYIQKFEFFSFLLFLLYMLWEYLLKLDDIDHNELINFLRLAFDQLTWSGVSKTPSLAKLAAVSKKKIKNSTSNKTTKKQKKFSNLFLQQSQNLIVQSSWQF